METQLRKHTKAAAAFSGVLLVLGGAVGVGFSLLVVIAGMMVSRGDQPLLMLLVSLAGLVAVPLFYVGGALIAAIPAVIAGILFFLAATSTMLNRVPALAVPFLCAAFGYVGVELSAVVIKGIGFNQNARMLGTGLGFVAGTALFWLPVLRPISEHLRNTRGAA